MRTEEFPQEWNTNLCYFRLYESDGKYFVVRVEAYIVFRGREVALEGNDLTPLEAEAIAKLFNTDAEPGQMWQCPDCDSSATLGNNAAWHVKSTGHALPTQVPRPEVAYALPSSGTPLVTTDVNTNMAEDERDFFSMQEIAAAIGRRVVGVGGISYGALELVIPLADGKALLLLRAGDEEDDREIRLTTMDAVNKEHRD